MISKEKILEDVRNIVSVLDEKEGIDITTIDMESTSLMVDYFVIVTGNSDTHMAALRDYVVQYLKSNKIDILSYDKDKGYDWMLIDAANIVIHIFSKEGRDFYDLEGLWGYLNKIDTRELLS